VKNLEELRFEERLEVSEYRHLKEAGVEELRKRV
jgi:hypothetical protein